MEVVAEVVLSTTLELLLEKLASSDSWKYVVGGRARSELKKWKSELVEIGEVLKDAEDKQIRKESVRKWLGQLRDLAYDMEDVLDEFGYHDQIMRRNDMMMMGAEADGNIHGEGGSSTSQVCRLFSVPSCCTTTFSTPLRNLKMGSKIEAITGRLEQISSERNKYGLDKAAAVTQYSTTWQRPLNTSLVNESEVYGRDVDKKRIIDMLLRLHKEDDNPHPTADQHSTINVFSVVSIVAMGGMGKTTLARLVYDDAEATKDFTLKAWACVSDQFDAERITKTILESIGVSHHPQDFNKLQENLREELKGKKFLLVLDDVWTDDPNHWYCLRAPFSSAARGSTIIVTTRDKRVAEVMGSGDKNLHHQLQPLSEEECWSVFKRHSNIDDQSTFASTGKQIVNKCDGLPLAARALGGLLSNQRRREEWDAVLTSPIWETKESSIIPALRLSYNYLPPHLKRCFAYCALFPKDYEFNKEELILLWMAQGFFEQSNQVELEGLGDDYFLQLVSKSFFQLSASNTSTFVMHDLIHDLAKLVSKETCLHLDVQLENDPLHSTSKSVRHLSYIPHTCDPYKRFEKFHKQSQLRTFMNIGLEEPFSFVEYYISSKVIEELIPQFICLRVLSLRNYEITEIPNSFGDQLKHLRYLDLSKTCIQRLPDSIGNLFYLQTLKLSKCQHLSKLPISIGNLMNLRHLDISGANKLEEVPSDIHKLKNLRLLSNFIVGENNGLSNLGGMTNLGGQLCISKLEKVVDIQDAGLISQQKLKSLIVKWSATLRWYLRKESSHLDVLRSLQPHTTLEQLRIEGYGGWEFPNWVGDASFSQMVDLTLKDCRNCTSLPCLGLLPSLKRLSIVRMKRVKKVGAEFYGANNISFPSLEYLDFEHMKGWEEWEDSNICLGMSKNSSFPCLQELRMRDCPNLTINIINFPTCLPCLTKLHITNCKGINNMEEEIMIRGGVDDHLIMTTNTTSLIELEIRSIPTLAKLDAGFVRGLRDLTISDCHGLTCLWDDDDDGGDGLGSENLHNSPDDDQMIRDQYCLGRRLGCNLRSLWIVGCGRLERLPNGWHKTLTCLEHLRIDDCPNLESFPEVGFPPKLRRLYLICGRLKCLPNCMMMSKMSKNSDINGSNNSCVLEFLEISWCPSLISLEGMQLPTTLKTVYIFSCDNLESLPAGVVVCAGLEVLHVSFCPSLTGFPKNNNSTSTSTTSPISTLKELKISHCENLKSLPEGIFMTDHDHGGGGPVLQVLEIDDCPSLQSFPEGMFPSTLEKLQIGGCGQLESISKEMFLHCSSSSSSSQLFLSLSDYPSLKALPDHHGLSGALSKIRITSCKNLELRPQQFQHFTRLRSLDIRDCENIKTPLSQWGLTRLPSLKSLSVGGIFLDATSFSDHQQSLNTSLLLPTTLTALGLFAFPNLESIASLSLQNLSSLERLEITRCPKLRSILPRKKRLPPTLLYLLIERSLLLEKRYSKKGKDWSKIAHIPHVDIVT